MTVCEKCRRIMKITTATFDLGDGTEEIDVEACIKCDIIYLTPDSRWEAHIG